MYDVRFEGILVEDISNILLIGYKWDILSNLEQALSNISAQNIWNLRMRAKSKCDRSWLERL